MISILYPEGDYTSADIAIKLQALAQAQANQVFIVPKHFGRNDENVYKNLKASKTAILLIHGKSTLDESTLTELKYLLKNKSRIYSIAPTQAKKSIKLPPGIFGHFYDKRKPGDFLNTVQNIVTDLQNQKQPVSADFRLKLARKRLITTLAYANLKSRIQETGISLP